jgi:hypothetical protein
VPETALRRSLQAAAKIDNAISALARKYLSILICTFETAAVMKRDFSIFRKRLHGRSIHAYFNPSQMAGYSGTPLAQNLGIKPDSTVVVINEPANYRKWLGRVASHAKFTSCAGANSAFIHFFTQRRSELKKQLSRLRLNIADTGTLWVSWPKKSSGVATDITEDIIRDVALPLGFVDIKVCAVDETWSGLKLMIRRENRKSGK